MSPDPFIMQVPLKEAWLSGARDWTAAQRESYANDLTRPQLLAVTVSHPHYCSAHSTSIYHEPGY